MKIRTTIPSNNPYYIRQVTGGLNGAVAGSPTISGANVLANCVGYANGRFNEIINDPDLKGIKKAFKYQLVCNAENFIESAQRQGLKISSKPVVGGIMVWQKGSTLGGGDGAGHVAIVEQVYEDGSVYTSESGWGSREWAFKNLRRNNSKGRWGQTSAYKFRGCIINPGANGKPVPTPKLVVDGIGGVATVMRMQEFFKVSVVDGIISGQNRSMHKYFPSLQSVSFGSSGSATVKALQKWVGTTQDGILGQATVKAWQKKVKALGYNVGTVDGIFGKQSMKAYQECLNNDCKKKTPSPSPTPTKDIKVVDVSEFQSSIDWAKAKKDGVKGAIVRCGFRGATSGKLTEDARFLEHIRGAYKAGIPVSLYMFTEAINASEGAAEADFAIKMWQKANVPISFPIAVDTEAVNVSGERAKNLTKAQRTAAIKGFCDRIKAKGYTPMIYASTSWLNNKLDMSKLPFDVWVAQYNTTCDYKGKYIVWQYTSKGEVIGIKGNVDLNHCYIDPKEVKPPKKDEKKGYSGTFPSYKLTKTNAQVKADACKWAKWIANGVSFHYGCNEHAFHNGCYFCGTNAKFKKGHGIKEWETTYCCNPFVGAAWAHGGGDSTAYKLCHECNSWGFSKNDSPSYEKSTLFEKLGHPAKSSLKAGDVLCNHTHVALYVGDGKIAEASGLDDNVPGSKKWNDSIAVKTLTDAKYKTFDRAYRYKGSVNANRPLTNGEVSDRVADMQKFLIWYGCDLSADGIFGHLTLKALKDFQTKEMGSAQADGIAGEATIKKMKEIKK